MIYVIQQGQDGPVKIGFTRSLNVKKRIKQLQTGSPFRLRLLATIKGDSKMEQFLHRKFDGKRLNGEWFSALILRDLFPLLGEIDPSLCQISDGKFLMSNNRKQMGSL